MTGTSLVVELSFAVAAARLMPCRARLVVLVGPLPVLGLGDDNISARFGPSIAKTVHFERETCVFSLRLLQLCASITPAYLVVHGIHSILTQNYSQR
jgi:hypothetical protein